MFFVLLLSQDSLYFGNVFGYGGVITSGTGLSALFCGDVAYELCGFVVVQFPFELNEFRGREYLHSLMIFRVSESGRAVPGERVHY